MTRLSVVDIAWISLTIAYRYAAHLSHTRVLKLFTLLSEMFNMNPE